VGTALAAVVAITGAAVALPRIGREAPPFGVGDGYYIAMPEKASTPSDDGNGGADVLMTTNLPEGTRVSAEFELTDPKTMGGSGFGSVVSQGRIRLAVSGDCLMAPERQSHGFKIKILVSPGPSGGSGYQPENVYAELGRNFERLEGAQVTTYQGSRTLIADADYTWPPDKCQIVLEKSLIPAQCGPSGISPNDDQGGEHMEAVARSVVVTLNQLRICELYSYATKAFKAANPWPIFRDRTKAWVDGHRPLERENFNYYLTATITRMSDKRIGGTFDSPAWIDVDYFLRGRKVGHARFVASLGTAQYTRWQIAELQLF
jgi:hypothetical protein